MFFEKLRFKRLKRLFIITLVITTFNNMVFFPLNGNPVPIGVQITDDDHGGFPLISNNTSSVYFKQEIINVTIGSSKAYIQADYTFMNNDSTPVNMSVGLPFTNYYDPLKRPENIILTQNQKNLPYVWCEFPYNSTDYNFNAIMFNLTFNANEEITVHVQYSRNYFISRKYGCEYRYLVGTAKSWDHSIESAIFEFRILKRICNQIFSSIGRSSESYSHEIRENSHYYIVSIYFQNWIPNTDFSSVGVRWERSYPPDISGILIFVIGILAFLFILAKKYVR